MGERSQELNTRRRRKSVKFSIPIQLIWNLFSGNVLEVVMKPSFRISINQVKGLAASCCLMFNVCP